MTLSATALVTLVQAKQHLRKDAANSLHVDAEYVGVGDDSETEFTLDNTPVTGSLKLYLNNSLLTETTHYTISGATVTLVVYAPSGHALTASYDYAASANTFESYDDELIEFMINAATKKCEDYCGKAFIQRAITENRIGDGGTLLVLNKKPVNTLTSIVMNDSTLTEDTDFTLFKEEGHLKRPTSSASSFFAENLEGLGWINNYKIVITYNAGYAATRAATQALVPDAVMAVLMTVAALYENRLGLKSQSITGIGSQDVGELGGIPEQAKKLLGSLNSNLGIF